MLSELDVLKDVCERLERAQVAYMLTGSMAMNYYAQPRMTRDIDFVIEVEPADSAKLVAAFEPDYYVPHEALAQAIVARGMFNLLHLESVIKVDLMVRKSDPYRRLEFGRRISIALPGFSAWIVSKEDLILSKLVWGKAGDSESQRRDVRNLLSTSVDIAYLRLWAIELDVSDLLEEMLDERH
jgi:Nucleotidyl transferase AbiEii toxin, Type IV TA system